VFAVLIPRGAGQVERPGHSASVRASAPSERDALSWEASRRFGEGR